jgi:hypothetical protein
VFWGDAWARFQGIVKPEAVLVLSGKVEIAGTNVKMFIDEASTLDQAQDKLAHGFVLRIDPNVVRDEQLQQLRERCNTADAKGKLTFLVQRADGVSHYNTMAKIAQGRESMTFLCELFGDSNVLIDVEA